jgi:hypothetical protein
MRSTSFARIIGAEAEQQAAQKLVEAGRALGSVPESMQLRDLSTLQDTAGEKKSTIVFPCRSISFAGWARWPDGSNQLQTRSGRRAEGTAHHRAPAVAPEQPAPSPVRIECWPSRDR